MFPSRMHFGLSTTMSPRKRRSRFRFEAPIPSLKRGNSTEEKENKAEPRPSGNDFSEEPFDAENGSDERTSVWDGNDPGTTSDWVGNDAGTFFANELGAQCLEDGTSLEKNDALKISDWRVLWGLLMTTGSQKLTKVQYQSMRVIADAFRRLNSAGTESWMRAGADGRELKLVKEKISSLPHYSTLATKFKSILFSALTVRSNTFFEDVDTSKAGARPSYFASDSTGQVPVRTIMPSEYARADLATGPVFELMKSTSLNFGGLEDVHCKIPSVDTAECCDIWPIVAAREFFYGLPKCISVDVDDRNHAARGFPFAEVADEIQVSILGLPDLSMGISTSFKVSAIDGAYANLRGVIVAIWEVHHNSRIGCSEFELSFAADVPERDRRFARFFGFVDYRSPPDMVTVDVPEVPVESEDDDGLCNITERGSGQRKRRRASNVRAEAIRTRNEAMRKRRQQAERAWSGYVKPVIKPGDVVAMVRPCVGSITELDSRARLFVVHRFWTEHEERARHVFWVEGHVDPPEFPQYGTQKSADEICALFDESSQNLFRDVVECRLRKAHDGLRGSDKYSPISSMGMLDTGEPYFIYRFLLFWDGFEVTKGKSATGDGFYMVCLNLPSHARATSNSVRVISLSPPGVKISSVLKRIQDDIVTGMTTGFADIDASGTRRRIFLDLVGFLGDTPALNASLDTLGHTATSCCHLCKYSRQSTSLFGSRYTGETHNGLKRAAEQIPVFFNTVRDTYTPTVYVEVCCTRRCHRRFPNGRYRD